MTSFFKSLRVTVFALVIAASAQLPAQTTNKAPAEKRPAAEQKEAGEKKRPIPYRGNIVTIDKNRKTMTVNKRIFQITSETKIFKSDKPATLADGVVGEYVTGSYKKSDDGRLIANSVYFGGKGKGTAEKKKEPAKDSKESKS